MRPLVLPLALALTCPLGAVALGRLGADRLGTALGRSAAAAVAALPRNVPAAPPVEDAGELAFDSASDPAPAPTTGSRGVGRQRAERSRGRGTEAPPMVVIPARTVLALANAGAKPSAVPMAPSGSRPAGLRLMGVSGLGIGMRDGDVLTRVLGAPARSVASVVDAVIRSRARQLPRISAEFWRGDRRYSLVVELPYLAERSAEGGRREHEEPAGANGTALTPPGSGPKLRSL